jgi:hypothetical protein
VGRLCDRHAEFHHRGLLHFFAGERHEQTGPPP